jgi:TM2 domain-containing membrane protein YozV
MRTRGCDQAFQHSDQPDRPQCLSEGQVHRNMSVNKRQISKEKKLTLLLLCWLFGLFGVHRFYTGKYITGGLQLLTWGVAGILSLSKSEILTAIPIGLLLLGWIVDVMLIIMGKFTDKEGLPIVDWV